MFDYDLPTKLAAGKYYVPVTAQSDGEMIHLKFRYSETLLAEVKAMDGARWNPENKSWRVKDNQRNRFQLAYLSGENPYETFDKPLIEHVTKRNLYTHQVMMVRHMLTRHYCELAAEMGTGKTLAAIELMEASGHASWLWVGPKSANASVNLEFMKWGAAIRPKMVTYDGLKELVKYWPKDVPPPKGVIFDEASRLKNPMAQRTQTAMYLANEVRKAWGMDGYVILMSGTPAPKSPVDWWAQCEVACPGYLREGTEQKFRARLAKIEQRQSITGGMYPHLVTWWDDENKCGLCGKPESDFIHDKIAEVMGNGYHEFRKSTNEIHYLYKRMNGLVLVQFKKDCLDLPEKQYRRIEIKPSQAISNAASLIVASSPNTITALTLLRELSDGFQYQDIPKGIKECPLCHGTKVCMQFVPCVSQDEIDDELNEIEDWKKDSEGIILPSHLQLPHLYKEEQGECSFCSGTGYVPNTVRVAQQVTTPKDDALVDIMDAHDDDGRLVVYAGFQGSLDKLCELVKKQSWDYIRVDGRGWITSILGLRNPEDMLLAFQDKTRVHPKIIFLGQASSAGMGLTLTESCEIVYYSNDFNAESRAQSEDRIHRPGADHNRGVTITDLIHLPSDLKVLENLLAKRRLQDMSLGEFKEVLRQSDPLGPRLF